MYIIPQVKVKSCTSNRTSTPSCIISWWIGFIFHSVHHGKTFSACAPQSFKRKSSFLSVVFRSKGANLSGGSLSLSLAELTAWKHTVLKQLRQTRPADVDYGSCEGWSALGSHQPPRGLQLDSRVRLIALVIFTLHKGQQEAPESAVDSWNGCLI